MKEKDTLFHISMICISIIMLCAIIYFIIALPWYITSISVILGIIIVTNFDKFGDTINDCFRSTL